MPRSYVSAERRRHILDGDETGGGHRHGAGRSGKSEFPSGWSDERIIAALIGIADDPKVPMRKQGDRTVKEAVRDGISIRMIQDADGGIVTGYPTNILRNPVR